jgi:UDP-2,4-diacetamido-2,4,6-trideoxy-beta-L-altropyranose hydrolase
MAHDPRPLRVLFRVAAGPRVGFGHLVRASSLSRALEVPLLVSIRGTSRCVRETARRIGAREAPGSTAGAALAATRPDVLVLDDRVLRETQPWRRGARRLGIPVVSVHDLGIGLGAADLVVDGSVGAAVPPGVRALAGPRFAVLNPATLAARVHPARLADPADVIVALGGGPRRRTALTLARALVARRPGLRVAIAGGFAGMRSPGTGLPGIAWVRPRELALALANARVAVSGGGVTLYECLALGVPAVGVAVVPSQRPTVRAFASRGAVVDGGGTRASSRAAAIARLARQVVNLLDDEAEQQRVRRAGRALVDGRGGHRVARAIRLLAEAAGTARGVRR